MTGKRPSLLPILSSVKMSTKFYIVNNIVPVFLFAYRTKLDLYALCLRFPPPNQEKDATLFFLERAVFMLQVVRISCPETSVPNTNLRHIICEKSENLKPAPSAHPGSTLVSHKQCLNRRILIEALSN